LLLAAACASGDQFGADPNPSGERPLTEPVVSLTPDQATDLAWAVNEFGFDLFGELDGGEDDNVLTSPLSVAVVLGMLLGGAGGDTYDAIAETLHLNSIGLDETSYAALLDALDPTDEVALNLANSLWLRDDGRIRDEYVDFAREIFDAPAEEVDTGSQEAVDRIDTWVRERTEGLIEEIAEDLGLPDRGIVAVLLNAVYFLGTWQSPFDPVLTREGTFTRADGTEVTVPLMEQRRTYEHSQRDGFSVLRLPYGENGRFGMEVFLPGPGLSVAELAGELDATTWRSSLTSLTEQELLVQLPRFDLSYGSPLDDALRALGMGVAYSMADFSRMAPGVFLSTVHHKTRVKVDEKGTEAAAVTGAAVAESAAPTFPVDRPFLFTISDRETGTILFLGAVTDPTA
jgi:serine protease inhibitor